MEISAQQHLLPVVVVTVGMELKLDQFRVLFRAPRVPLLGSLIHTLSFPLVTVLLLVTLAALQVDIADATVMGMFLIAACPSGGFSNILAMIAKVNLPLSVTLTAVSSLASVFTVPLLIAGFAVFMAQFDKPIEVPIVPTLMQLLVLIVLPSAVGMAWRHHRPDFVEHNAPRL